jgi:hypothetical protein
VETENKNIRVYIGGYRHTKWIEVCFETHYGENDKPGLLCIFNHDDEHDIQVIIPEDYYHMLAYHLGDRYRIGETVVVEAPSDHTLMFNRTYSFLVVHDMIDPLAFNMDADAFERLHDAMLKVLGEDKFS